MKRHKTVEAYIESLDRFRDEIVRLREILTSTALVEEVKWGSPHYTHNGKILVGFAAFQEHFALWFHQGALLSDPEGVLINAQEGTTKALRQWRMKTKKDIKVRTIKAYVREAIAQQDQGNVIKPTRKKALAMPQELETALKKKAKAKKAFATLTPGRQREYVEYVDAAKRAETKERRIEKILPMIEAGQGLHDKYRNC